MVFWEFEGFFLKNLYNELLEKIFSNVCSGFDAIYGNISMNKIRVAEIRIFMWTYREFHG